jgi:hypothetical protein
LTRRGTRLALLLFALAALLALPASAAALNPVTFSPAGDLTVARDGPGAARLPDGRVLVVGGYDDHQPGNNYLASTEFYSPSTNSFSPGPTMPSRLYAPAVASLPDGRVLIAGGYNGDLNSNTPTARVFNPQTGTFSLVGSMMEPVELAGVAALPDGRIMIIGGYTNANESINRTEIFNPDTNSFSFGPAYPKAAYGVAAAPISGGRVLAVGGYDSHTGDYFADAFTSTGGAFSQVSPPPTKEYYPASAPLPGGRALIAGGYDGNDYLTSAFAFNPGTSSFSSAGIGALQHKREEPGAAELTDGRVLVAGGWDGSALKSAEILSVPNNSFKAKLKGRKVIFKVGNEGTGEVTDTSTKLVTTAKKKKPKLIKTTTRHGGPGKIKVKIKLTKRGASQLAAAGKLKLKVAYTPDQGLAKAKKLKLRAGK